MAALVMLFLIGTMILTLFVLLILRKGLKKVLLTFAGFLAAIGLFFLYAEHACGPNAKDVAFLKPEAKIITNYILDYGLPESMQKIPNLPYDFDNCKKKIQYAKRENGSYHESMDAKNATGEIIEEKCTFANRDRTCDVEIRYAGTYDKTLMQSNNNHDLNSGICNCSVVESAELRLTLYVKASETGMAYDYVFDKKLKKWRYYNNPFLNDEKEKHIRNPQVYSTKNDGICNPLRM